MKYFTAKLDKYELNILDISDTALSSNIRHEFINTDGAIIQPLGRRAHEVRFKAYFIGLDLNSTNSYLSHFDFINDMADNKKPHTLVHPKYGTISGYVDSLSIVNNDMQDYCEIDITFVQEGIQNELFLPPNTLAQINSIKIALFNAQLAKLNSELKGMNIVGRVIDATQKMAQQFNDITQSTRNFLNEADDFCNDLDTIAANIIAPINSVDSAINFVADVPSRILGSINNVTNRVITSLVNLSNLPVQFTNNLTLGLQNISTSITGPNATFFRSHFASWTAGSILNQATQVLQTDDTNRNTVIAKEATPTFDMNGNRLGSSSITTVLTTQDIDTIMSVIRTYVADAICMGRQVPPPITVPTLQPNDGQLLKQMASSVTTYITDIKLKKLSQANMVVNNIPLHVLCMQLGLSYQAAERILAINQSIKNPTFTEGNIKVYTI